MDGERREKAGVVRGKKSKQRDLERGIEAPLIILPPSLPPSLQDQLVLQAAEHGLALPLLPGAVLLRPRHRQPRRPHDLLHLP